MQPMAQPEKAYAPVSEMPQNKAAVSYFAASHLLQMHQANHLYKTVFLFSAHIVYMMFIKISGTA